MKISMILAIILACIVPSAIVPLICNNFSTKTQVTTTENELMITENEETPPTQNVQMEIAVLHEGEIKQYALEDYIVCVVLGEMPADFEMDALKAQAVVARTYTARKLNAPKHDAASVCANSTCCQAFQSVAEYLEEGGSPEFVERVRQAVQETQNIILTYDGELIEATYFSCSGGRTEDAVAVWGMEVPYLQSVSSPGEENATHYMDTVTFSATEFSALLGIVLDGYSGQWIGEITYTEGGGVDTIQIGAGVFSGTSVRQKLGLRSTAFVVTAVGDTVTVTTKGFGHRVGMSQYGADAMAASGYNWKQILEHYYMGTQIAELSVDNLS